VVGIPKIRAYAEEKKVCLMLNVRPDLIEEGPVDRIVETVAKLIGEGAGKGKFELIINLVPVGTPVEHAHAAVAAIKQFGRYPISPVIDPGSFKAPSFQPFDEWVRRNGYPV
jgi:uroporphyrinogen-III decarboxylase